MTRVHISYLWSFSLVAVCVLVLALTGLYGAGLKASDLTFPDEAPSEPSQYRMKDYRSKVPCCLQGARVVTPPEAMALHRQGQTIFIDVMPTPPRPPKLPEGVIWRDKVHLTIKGGVWLANVGYGLLTPEMKRYFSDHLDRLTGGNKHQPLLFYCLENCWMSWNAAKRALVLGYRQVTWYPSGTDGWVRSGGVLVEAHLEPLPTLNAP